MGYLSYWYPSQKQLSSLRLKCIINNTFIFKHRPSINDIQMSKASFTHFKMISSTKPYITKKPPANHHHHHHWILKNWFNLNALCKKIFKKTRDHNKLKFIIVCTLYNPLRRKIANNTQCPTKLRKTTLQRWTTQ